MFCPQCGNKQSDELKFCNLCGANLYAVRQVVATREAADKFDWSKTWVAEMFMSEAERKRRQEEIERQRGVTPEIKRYNEIKAGVIVSSIGLALMLVLFVIGMAISRGPIPPEDAELVRSIWVGGFIPFMIGLALIFNGLFVSRKIVELKKRARLPEPEELPQPAEPQPALKSADTSEFIHSDFSVTEGTTKHLHVPGPKR
ncbi:MAG: zinc ribbon domain-containing protein [Pyrinomonadaceae bacterium]